MQEWIWRDFRFELPNDWEMLQFSKERAAGNCTFADRHQFRLELSWKEVPAAPDYERMISDYLQRLKDEQSLEAPEAISHRSWQGFAARFDDTQTARFGRYFEPAGRLLELVFFWPKDFQRQLTKEILDSFRHLNQEAAQHWRAFGLDLHATGGLALDSCEVKPALAQMTFSENGGAGRIESFQRLGMVNTWLTGTVQEWLKGKAPQDINEVEYRSRDVGDHHLELAAGTVPPLKFPKVGRAAFSYRAAAWICPADGRLYSASEIAPAKNRNDRLAGKRLICCEGLASA